MLVRRVRTEFSKFTQLGDVTKLKDNNQKQGNRKRPVQSGTQELSTAVTRTEDGSQSTGDGHFGEKVTGRLSPQGGKTPENSYYHTGDVTIQHQGPAGSDVKTAADEQISDRCAATAGAWKLAPSTEQSISSRALTLIQRCLT